MHPSICAAVSKEFYGGRLVTAPAAAARQAVAAPCRLIHVKGWEQQRPGAGYWNAKEAGRCVAGCSIVHAACLCLAVCACSPATVRAIPAVDPPACLQGHPGSTGGRG